MKKIYFIIIFLIISNLAMPQNNAGVKILVFDKVGQKELIKVGEKIQVVLGNSIQPEFCYFKYKTEKNINEFSIELKSNLSYLMEISRLKNANGMFAWG